MVETIFAEVLALFDAGFVALAVPLVFWLILSGIDDVAVDLISTYAAIQRRRSSRCRLASVPAETFERRIAIIVPCWREHAVIARMIQQNVEAIRYSTYDIFIGAYPNDAETISIVNELTLRFANVHIALCPHPGPTSKADCLNWILQKIVSRENDLGIHYEIVVTHDAEDVIHPDALSYINHYSRQYAMVQVPVLPLRMPVANITHGVYCDEFTEYQRRDMPARQIMGAFIPSNGVGTGFRRDALETLAASGQPIFDPAALTEDYENGYRLRLQGEEQLFVTLSGQCVATREFFPHTFRTAVRQRTRWVTGITLQTWARYGWQGRWVDRYWLWRDRKGLIGNPVSVLANLLSLYWILSLFLSKLSGRPWPFQAFTAEYSSLLACTALLGIQRLLFRAICVSRSFGWLFALPVIVRVPYANIINSVAVLRAVTQFAIARIRGQPLAWCKTEHSYPPQVAFVNRWRRLGELLVEQGCISSEDLSKALTTLPAGRRLGEQLVRMGGLTEEALYAALSLQSGLPHHKLTASEIPQSVARTLPGAVSRELRVLPFRIEYGNIHLAIAELPSPAAKQRLRRFTNLGMRFYLVTPTNFSETALELLQVRQLR